MQNRSGVDDAHLVQKPSHLISGFINTLRRIKDFVLLIMLTLDKVSAEFDTVAGTGNAGADSHANVRCQVEFRESLDDSASGDSAPSKIIG